MFRLSVFALAAAMLLVALPAHAQLPKASEVDALQGELKMTIRRGLRYLHKRYDVEKKGWGHPGIDALTLTAIVRSPDGKRYDDTDPFIRGPVDNLISMQGKNGAISFQGMLANYITSVSIVAFCEVRDRKMIKDAERAKRLDAAIEKAKTFLVELQADEGEGYTKKDPLYGGVGYGGDMRPDLSNTQLAIEAAKKAGLDKDHPFFKKAITFLKRTQNRSESNKQEWAGDDGGFVYYPGKTYAGTFKKADGSTGLRSYGSMTYAGMKSYIYAGVEWKDPLVQSAMKWIKGNYTVKTHPNMGNLGLYYYFHTFAKTMALISSHSGTRQFQDIEGRKHDWAFDLATQLSSLQAKDGSWKNSNGKWMEGQPILATTYAVLALNYTYPLKATPKKDAPKKDAPKKDAPKKDAPKKDAPKKK